MRYRWLPIAGAVFLVIAITIQFFVSYNWEEKRVLEHIDYEMRLAQKDFIFGIYDIQDAGEDMHDYMVRHLDSPDGVLHETLITLKRNKNILACYVGFRPGFYNEKDYWHCPCAYLSGDSIITLLYGDEKHDYFQSKWYQGALKSDKNGYWSPSYRDEDFAELICTHSVRVDYNDSLACVIGLDFSMEWVRTMLEKIKPYSDAWCKLYNSDGTLILESGYIGETESPMNIIVHSATLTPMDMRLEIGVPNRHVLESIRSKFLITLAVLLLGITIAGWLIRRIRHDQASYARVETENKVMENELRIASGIQMGILKGSTTDGRSTTYVGRDAGYLLEAGLTSMREVGGDLYDFYRNDDDLYFIIGDVSGKSVSAAMFMSSTVNLFRSAVRRLPSPKAIIEDMNSVLSDNNPSLMFVTAFVGRLHIPTGEMLYCNAGHMAPLVKGQSDQVPSTKVVEVVPNIPMGYDGRFRFEEQGMLLGEGETLVLYTDGITEARNEKHEMLGLKRWREIVERVISSNDTDNLRAIGEAGMRFIGKAEQTDDITVMCISKTSPTEPLRVRVENRADQWPALKTAIHNYGLCAGMDKRTLKKIEVAVEEAVVNIVSYSQATWIELKGDRSQAAAERAFCITLTDNGVAFDPTVEKPEEGLKDESGEWRVGGLGISLIRQIADEVHYRRTNDNNELTIIKNIYV